MNTKIVTVYDVHECKWGRKEPRIVAEGLTRQEATDLVRNINTRRGCLGVKTPRLIEVQA